MRSRVHIQPGEIQARAGVDCDRAEERGEEADSRGEGVWEEKQDVAYDSEDVGKEEELSN